ncbi:uncharacterized protein LOC110435860 [Sorghum bicolor]|uniref:uncharacterized protein LOC110435860 n=1 Tax=Sorghum bicolor TaxID=4558 RepID=UPI000B425C10|nr:uncharacterized protein LOC110435860 [Sorghum bicolor]|eukprot:XP_021317616.1 uncharacterized protein LOC110435860 [Sorghum bicolor]
MALIQGPWILLGDFNLVCSPADKNNGQINSSLASAFNEAILDLLLIEIELSDRLYTWTNKQSNPILAKLDRAFTNFDLDQLFPMANLSSLPRPTSDHTPVMLTLSTTLPKTTTFHFENFWLHNSSFLPHVTDAWNRAPMCADAARQLAVCIKSTRTAIKVWARCIRAPIHQINDCQFLVQLFDFFEETRALSNDEFQARQLAQEGLESAIKAKASYWKQCSKHKAIKESDANTAFNHTNATQRFRHNNIRLVRVNGNDIVNHDGKTLALTDFFSSIIGNQGSSAAICLSNLYKDAYTPAATLTAPFTESEVKKALLLMNRNSAPGLNGFRLAFYRAAWPLVKDQIMQFMVAFHSRSVSLDFINRSHMVLIPKKVGAVEVDAFRPICLQNCTMKILSKVLTSRLQDEIPRLIDIHQTGFIRGKSISDTFVHAMELVQVCNKRKLPTIILKLDFAKAFDMVNWEGMFCVLCERGFSDLWVKWMSDILSSSKSVAHLLNPMGRTVLINYVLDSQLVYCMSSLQLPPAVITQMDKKRRPSSGQFDVWAGDEALADSYPALLSHHSKHDATIQEVISNGIHAGLRNRLSPRAAQELTQLGTSKSENVHVASAPVKDPMQDGATQEACPP